METDPKRLDWYDDLAVAYDKTGQQKLAIETILKKEKIKPGLYETYANLGTFHIHSGNFDQGLEFIDKAIEVNPGAHFGREIYQRLLVQYIKQKRKNHQDNSSAQPKQSPAESHGWETVGFAQFVLEEQNISMTDRRAVSGEIEKAIKGVAGMMHFGHYDSPVLLEAMADLLMAPSRIEDARLLATRALLKASYETKNKAAKTAFRSRATEVLSLQHVENKLDDLESEFKSEIKAASDWFAELRQNEIDWIKDEDVDPEEQYSRVYYSPDGSIVVDRVNLPERVAVIALVCLGVALLFKKLKQTHRQSE